MSSAISREIKRRRAADDESFDDDPYIHSNSDDSTFRTVDIDQILGIPNTSIDPSKTYCWGCEYGIEKPDTIGKSLVRDKLWEVWTNTKRFPLSYRFQKVAEAHDKFVVQTGIGLNCFDNIEPWLPEEVAYHFSVCLSLPEIRQYANQRRVAFLENSICKTIVKEKIVDGKSSGELAISNKDLESYNKLVRLGTDLEKLSQKKSGSE